MPRIAQFYGIIVSMYYDDHNPPHFHVQYGDFEAEVLILDCSIHKGELSPRVRAFVLEWWDQHRSELADNWKRCHTGQRPLPIAPLE